MSCEGTTNVTDANVKELLDRTRRIETRLTAGLESLGATVKTQKPVYSFGIVTIPSFDVRLRDILDAIPVAVGRVDIVHDGMWVAHLSRR